MIVLQNYFYVNASTWKTVRLGTWFLFLHSLLLTLSKMQKTLQTFWNGTPSSIPSTPSPELCALALNNEQSQALGFLKSIQSFHSQYYRLGLDLISFLFSSWLASWCLTPFIFPLRNVATVSDFSKTYIGAFCFLLIHPLKAFYKNQKFSHGLHMEVKFLRRRVGGFSSSSLLWFQWKSNLRQGAHCRECNGTHMIFPFNFSFIFPLEWGRPRKREGF